MPVRAVLVAVASAATLALTMSATASAAEGKFTYHYLSDDGVQVGQLVDPPSRECHNIPDGVENDPSIFAFDLHNKTNSTVTLFNSTDCDGTDYYTLWPGGKTTKLYPVRSVLFS